MLKNYFKLAWRNVKRNKGFFAINFIGLFISVAACILIALLILHELSFDKKINSSVHIYRVVDHSTNSGGVSYSPVTPYPLATALRTQMPDEKLISQIHNQENSVVSYEGKKIKEKNILFADSVFPALFNIKVLKGNIDKALAQPGFAILTASTAKKYYGTENPLGKRIKLDNLIELEIAAVIKEVPANSHLPYSMLVSYTSLKPDFIGGLPLDQWGVNSEGFVYIGVNDKSKIKQVEASLASIADKNINANDRDSRVILKLQPVEDIHYNQLYAENNIGYTINYRYLYLTAFIALFLILAACINYTNLSTSLAVRKSREVGVRKTMGAERSHLIRQFFSETFLLTGIVILAAAVSIRFFLPAVNTFLDKNIPLSWLNWRSAAFLLALWILISLLSGIYPALVLSGFNPVQALKNKFSSPKASAVFLKRGLVVFQFLTAQVLIIGAIVVAKQMNFIQSTPLGFQKEKIVDIALPENKTEQLSALKNKLTAIPGISSISFSLGAPVSDNGFRTDFNRKEKFASEKITVDVKVSDKNYMNTYGLQLIAGRWFDENDERKIDRTIPDSLRQYVAILNETAVKKLGFASAEDALGKHVQLGLNDLVVPVIGVIKDYHVESLHENVMPVLMMQFPFFYYNAGIKLSSGYSSATIAAIDKAWSSVYPDHLFETNFLDEHIAALYKNEKRTMQLFNLFTVLSIVINALGLIGLLSFMIQQKTKEIGVRKVLGATAGNISYMLSKDFLKLITIAFVIAAPVGRILMNKWLQDFAYRTTINWWVFGVALLVALVVTFVTIGFQTIRAALANPVKSLRTE